ncbi:MAG: ABC transporter substrate-binding protein [Longimicrobiaceae bacterium]
MSSCKKIASAVLWAALVVACDRGPEAGGGPVGEPEPGGTAVFGVLADFSGFNPVTNTSSATFDVMRYMLFTPIVQYDEELNVQPYLAESWELEDDHVTFRLRDDVRWHDGEPVTVEDVKFTFDLAKNEDAASLIGTVFLGLVESATVVDPRTVRFDFVAPHAQALENFWWSPLPEHLLGEVSPAELARAPFNRDPVGSGPFRFVSWQSGSELVLERNSDFPEGLGGPPMVERVVFRVIPEATTMLTELFNGSVDLIGYTLLPQQAQQIEQQGGVDLRHFPSKEFAYVGWNNQRELFSDAGVRRALTMSINRPQIIEALLLGYGAPAVGMIPPWSPFYTELEPLPYDPERARRLFAEAGWQDRDGDGVMESEAGSEFRFTLLTNSENRLRQDIATVVQSQLREVGVAAEIRTSEFQTMLDQHRNREYDAIISGWILDNFKIDPSPLFSCREARTERSANRAGYCNPDADALLERGLRTVAGPQGALRQTWAEHTRVLQQDQPITFLFWQEDLAGIGPRIQGVEMDVRSKLVNVGEWWIPADRQR